MPYSAPSAHLNVTSTYGVDIPVGSVANAAERTSTSEAVKILGEDGEILKMQCAPMVKQEIKIDYVGAPAFSVVTPGEGMDPADSVPMSASMTENNSKEASGSISATSYADRGSPGADVGAGSGDTALGTIIIKSVTTTLVESVQREVKVKDVMVPGTDGKASTGYRGNATLEGSFSVRFRGDIPTGIVLGIGGASLYAFTTGVRAVTKLMENQKIADVNGGEYSGEWAPAAS